MKTRLAAGGRTLLIPISAGNRQPEGHQKAEGINQLLIQLWLWFEVLVFRGPSLCCSMMECFCTDRTFHFVPFTIVFGDRPSLTSSGHRIPFCRLQCRLRPLGNMRRLHFPADSTLKESCGPAAGAGVIRLEFTPTPPPPHCHLFICLKNSSHWMDHKCWKSRADFIDAGVWN